MRLHKESSKDAAPRVPDFWILVEGPSSLLDFELCAVALGPWLESGLAYG